MGEKAMGVSRLPKIGSDLRGPHVALEDFLGLDLCLLRLIWSDVKWCLLQITFLSFI